MKIDVNVKNKKKKTLLHICRDINIVKLLIENKADVNAKDSYESTPLFYCVDENIASLLIENKANVNILKNDWEYKEEESYEYTNLIYLWLM